MKTYIAKGQRQGVKIIVTICLFLFLLIVVVPILVSGLPVAELIPGYIAQPSTLSEGASKVVPGGDIVVSGSESSVLVYREASQQVESIDLEDYVAGVVAGEMPSSFEMEALKAQAVAARTYVMSRKAKYDAGNNLYHEGAYVCDTAHCQAYLTEAQLAERKSDEWMAEGWQKIKAAVKATEGQQMYYNGELVMQPLFHSSSGSRTENSEDVFVSAVPYLRSVESPYEQDSPYLQQSSSFTLEELTAALKKKYGNVLQSTLSEKNIFIAGRTDGNGVALINFGELALTGRQVRELLNLRSADFEVEVKDGSITFITEGYGHGVGMSQYGANGMAKAGYTYEQILEHYYSGVTIK